MSLVQKLSGKWKRLSKAAVLSAGILSAFVGCATTTDWETVGTEYQPTGIEKRVVVSETPKKIYEIVYTISQPYFANGYNVKVEESKNEINSKLRVTGTKQEFEGIVTEQRAVNNVFPAGSILGTVVGGIGGGIGGAYLGMLMDDYEGTGGAIIFGVLGGAVGILGGMYLGVMVDDLFWETETRSRNLNNKMEELPSRRKTEEIRLGTNLVYRNNPASNINAKITGGGRFQNCRTDNKGELNLSDFIESLNLGYFFKEIYWSSDELEKRIKQIPLVKEIKPQTLETLLDDLVNVITEKNILIGVETKETSNRRDEKITNDSNAFRINGYQLADESIYQVVRNFVDEEINSRINILNLVAKDLITHVPIGGFNLESVSNAPPKADLVDMHFMGRLKEYAERYVKDYLYGKGMTEGISSPGIDLHMFYPSRISLEVTHPDYNFVTGEIVSNNEDMKRTVYMVDKGQKIRVEEEAERGGRIE